jgi:hypothetical protein
MSALSAAECAAACAPNVDRLRIAISGAMRPAMGSVIDSGRVDERGGYVFAMLRNLMPDRVAAMADVERVFAYQPGVLGATLPALQAGGLVIVDASGVRLSDDGRELMTTLHEVSAAVVNVAWAGFEAPVATLVELLGTALAATPPTSGAYAVLAPPYSLPSATPAARVAEQISSVRFHRFDAHIDAWTESGLTAAAVQALDDPALLAEIETETNRRDGAIWQALAPDARQRVVAALGELPAP